jgi:Mannosylglycerate hydrolase MGH1-like glycoside hydrolase domain
MMSGSEMISAPPGPGGAVAALQECQRVLRQNWRTGTRDQQRYAYTCPSPYRYPWQWYWDSCLSAVAWRHFDPSRARAELESLLEGADEDGFIGHTIFWDRPVSLSRLPFYNVRSRRDSMTATIQPPLLAWTWRIAVGDPAADPRIVRHHDVIRDRRDLEGDGLLWIIQPDESGLDASPEFDAVWGWRTGGRPGFPLLVARNRRLGFDAARVRSAGAPLVCHTLVNVIHGLSELALGRPSITPALMERLYDPEAGLFFDDVWPPRRRPRILTWSSLAPLALPDLPEEVARRLVEEHLLDDARFWLAVPPPSVAADEPSFSTQDRSLGLRRYWRGPTWVNSAWLLWLGLCRLGYDTEAATLSARVLDAVAREGLREYYDPHSGLGMGARDFAWSALASEFVARDARATRSYL